MFQYIGFLNSCFQVFNKHWKSYPNYGTLQKLFIIVTSPNVKDLFIENLLLHVVKVGD